MATITVRVRAKASEEALDYMERVVEDLRDGCVAGHVDQGTHWDSDLQLGYR